MDRLRTITIALLMIGGVIILLDSHVQRKWDVIIGTIWLFSGLAYFYQRMRSSRRTS